MSLAASNPAAELEALRAENARLISLLESHSRQRGYRAMGYRIGEW